MGTWWQLEMIPRGRLPSRNTETAMCVRWQLALGFLWELGGFTPLQRNLKLILKRSYKQEKLEMVFLQHSLQTCS